MVIDGLKENEIQKEDVVVDIIISIDNDVVRDNWGKCANVASAGDRLRDSVSLL